MMIIYHTNIEVKKNNLKLTHDPYDHILSTEKAMKSTSGQRYPQIVVNLWISRRKDVENGSTQIWNTNKYQCGYCI